MSYNGEQLYHGKGDISMQDDYMDFINYVFGFNGDSEDFYKLLPKLYKRELNPAASSYVTMENGKLKAAIGAFDNKITVCGESLNCRGIGNVAVHPFSRSKGYMRVLMNMSTEDMIKDNIDMGILGGRRQRYNYFGYEKSGTSYSFSVNDDNIRHTFGKDRKSALTFRIIQDSNDVEIERIAALSETQSYAPVRDRALWLDISNSWGAKLYAIYENGEFFGYCICNGTKVCEINLREPTKDGFIAFVVAFFDFLAKRKLSVSLPDFQPDYIDVMYGICEGYEIGLDKSFSVYNYERVIRAFMALKSTYKRLPDGELSLLIHGIKRDERLKISVLDGVPAVTPINDTVKVDVELSHIEAVGFLFSPLSPRRREVHSAAETWLPLPIWMYGADCV